MATHFMQLCGPLELAQQAVFLRRQWRVGGRNQLTKQVGSYGAYPLAVGSVYIELRS